MGRAKNKKRDFQRKAPLGQGKSARSERKKKKRAQQELQAQLGQLHQAKKRKLQQAGVATDKSTGFAQAISGKSRVNEENLLPLKRFFWPEPKPEEPDDQLKLLRKNLGIKVKGSPIPSPVEQLADSRLPAEFGLFFKGPRGRKLTKPTPIQMQVWPAALCGLDIMGIAPTGSGKTLAYLLPAAVHVAGQESKKENLSPGALVLLPTRELASQVSDQFNGKGGLRQVLKLRCAAIYGGVGKELQLDQLLTSGCPEVLSATPGRLLDLLGLDALTLDSVTFLVLDEADRMLQLGFEEQLDAVAKAVRRDRQCLLFSATFPERLRQAADRWMTFPEKTVIRVAAVDVGSVPQDDVGTGTGTLSKSLPEASTGSTGSTLTVSKNITQMVHVCAEHKKFRKLARFMDKIRQKEKEEGVRQRALVIIFCNKIQTLKSVSGFLRKHKHHCEALHSGIPQAKRENALNMFKAGQMQVLVATDVAARGLHVKHLRYVVNYDFPSNLEQYCHRIGRTGRDGEAGTAYSFFTRNLAPLSRDLIQLLERSDQEVDPNLRALAEGKVQQPGEKSSAEEEASEEVVDEASADEAPPLGPSGGGLRITPRKRGGVEDESSEEDVSEGMEFQPISQLRPKETKIRAMHGRRGMFTERTPLTDEGPETDELYGIEDTAIRHGFVRKVFSILLVQLVTTVLVGGVVMKMALPISKANPALTMALMMGSMVIAIACMCIFACCPHTMREMPTNYILLGAFTLAEAVLVGFISASYTQASVLIVLATTCIVVMGLILFACQTTYDITGFLPYVLVACLALFGFGMILTLSVFFGALTTSSPVFQTMHLVYSICGVLIFSCFIVLDTQLIVGGKHSKYRFGVDDYCMAAINLYMDIVQLFLYLLQLLGERR